MSSEPSDQKVEAEALTGLMQEYSDRFDELCRKRHADGAAEYGQFTFIGNDVVRMMAEELADTANYCRMQFVKLMFLQEVLVDQLGDQEFKMGDENISIGKQSFKGTKKGW